MKWNLLRGIGGEFELGRVMLAGSGALAITSPIGFQLADMLHNGWHFNVAEWCTAYPGGLAALNALGVYAIGKKDQAVAAAKVAQAAADTGAKP